MRIDSFRLGVATVSLFFTATTPSFASIPNTKGEVQPLLHFAHQKGSTPSDRYLALMEASRLGGQPIQKQIQSFLNDPSWELRTGALRSLAAIHAKESGPQSLRLLKDPALVVRLAAVDAVLELQPEGTVAALIEALEDQSNYHRGNPLWVPPRILNGLKKLGIPQPLRPRYQRWLSSLHVQDLKFKEQASSLIR